MGNAPARRRAAAADAAVDAADLLPGAVRGGGGELGGAPGRPQPHPAASHQPLPLHGGERRSQKVATLYLLKKAWKECYTKVAKSLQLRRRTY